MLFRFAISCASATLAFASHVSHRPPPPPPRQAI